MQSCQAILALVSNRVQGGIQHYSRHFNTQFHVKTPAAFESIQMATGGFFFSDSRRQTNKRKLLPNQKSFTGTSCQ